MRARLHYLRCGPSVPAAAGTSILQLPTPSSDALDISAALSDRIRAALRESGGWMSFERYMQLALYEPGLGYYSAGSTKLGPAGDFTTAPECGPWFGRLIAAELAPLLARFDRPVLLELGAGTGSLAAQLLDGFAAGGVVEPEYRILEVSADLRARQQSRLRRFAGRVRWLDSLPSESFDGVVLANEVLDALPVTCFVKRAGHVLPLGVVWREDGFGWAEGPPDARLSAAVERLESALGRALDDGYRSELCPGLAPWVGALADVLRRGALLLIDYGLVRREYYHPQRRRGTLVCHYRHRAHENPFLWPGLQDISAWVDFSAVADAACATGLAVDGFTTQGQFLVTSGARNARLFADAAPADLAAFKTLVLPGEMGERFKLMLLGRDVGDLTLPGRDLRARL
jgi:SAM-dependent MidA family methyltransferase